MPKEHRLRNTAGMLLRELDNGSVELCLHDVCFVAPWVDGKQLLHTLRTNNLLDDEVTDERDAPLASADDGSDVADGSWPDGESDGQDQQTPQDHS